MWLVKCLTKNVQGLGENTDMGLFILEICQINIINYQSELHRVKPTLQKMSKAGGIGENFTNKDGSFHSRSMPNNY